MKKVLLVIAGLLGIVGLAALGIYLFGGIRADRRVRVPGEVVRVPGDSAGVVRGRRVATFWGCPTCHGADLGGAMLVDAPVFARVGAPNLTPGRGGVGANYTVVDWERAIRHGVARDGRGLLLMDVAALSRMDDADLGALIAYLQRLEPVDREMGVRALGPIGRAAMVIAPRRMMPALGLDREIRHRDSVVVGPTVEYGAYLATSCRGCHGNDLSGGPIPVGPQGVPPAANLTPDAETGLGRWTESAFARALREGVRPDGTRIDPYMPWQAYADLTDEEISALWSYLRTLTPVSRPHR